MHTHTHTHIHPRSACIIQFGARKTDLFLAVGTTVNLILRPKTYSQCFIRIYKFTQNHCGLQLVHKVTKWRIYCVSVLPQTGIWIACVRVCVCANMGLNSVYVCVCGVRTWVWIYVYICTYMCMCVCVVRVFVWLSSCVCTCLFVRVCILFVGISLTCMFTRNHTHSYTHHTRKHTWHTQTAVDDIVLAMAPFEGRLLVGVGKCLRVYDIGKKKLLKKCENKVSAHTHAHTYILIICEDTHAYLQRISDEKIHDRIYLHSRIPHMHTHTHTHWRIWNTHIHKHAWLWSC